LGLNLKKKGENQQLAIIPIWHLAVFFMNYPSCANGGNQISKYFDLAPPTLEGYVSHVIS
jgi:hypothetical protein